MRRSRCPYRLPRRCRPARRGLPRRSSGLASPGAGGRRGSASLTRAPSGARIAKGLPPRPFRISPPSFHLRLQQTLKGRGPPEPRDALQRCSSETEADFSHITSFGVASEDSGEVLHGGRSSPSDDAGTIATAAKPSPPLRTCLGPIFRPQAPCPSLPTIPFSCSSARRSHPGLVLFAGRGGLIRRRRRGDAGV